MRYLPKISGDRSSPPINRILLFSVVFLLFAVFGLLFTSFTAHAQVTEYPSPPAECSLDKPYEIVPSCAQCSDILFCWGNNYRACTTDAIFPDPALGENRTGYMGVPGDSIVYNGSRFPVPEGGVFFCDSNVFGCVNERCRGEGGLPGGFGTRYTTITDHTMSSDDELGGSYTFELKLTEFTATTESGVPEPPNFVGEQIALVDALVNNVEDLPAPRFPFLSILRLINRKLTPAALNFIINKPPPDEVQSFSFHPVCDVEIDENVEDLSPPPTSPPALSCEETGPIACAWCTNPQQCAGAGGNFYDSCDYCSAPGDGCCDVPEVLAAIEPPSDILPEAEFSIDYEMQIPWTDHIADTRLSQSVLVPDKSTGGTLNIHQPQKPPDEVANRYLAGAPDGQCGTTLYNAPDAPERKAKAKTIYIRNEEVNRTIDEYLADLKRRMEQKLNEVYGVAVNSIISFTIKDNNYCTGCGNLGTQTTGGEGFTNSFLANKYTVPLDHAQPNPDKRFVENPETGDGTVSPIEMTYSKIGKTREGWDKLHRSILPAKFQGQIQIAATYPTIGSSGIAIISDSGLYYTIPYMDSSIAFSASEKERIISLVLASWSNSKIRERWDTVVNRTRAAGINPAFALAIWIEESGASGVTANSDFGWAPHLNPSFEESLASFIDFTLDHPSNFEEWVRYFCGPTVEPICNNNPNFIDNLKSWYDKVIPCGRQGSSSPC